MANKKLIRGVAIGGAVLAAAGGVGVVVAEGGLGTHDVVVNGAGSTAAANFYFMTASQFGQRHQQIQISYAATGSGAGIKALESGSVAFAATDTPLTAEQMSGLQKKIGKVVQLPMLDGSTDVIYNLPGIHKLTLSPKVLTSIFSGQITSWNNAEIQALNPGVYLPAEPISVVYRGGSSGTSASFSEYLARNDPRAKKLIGVGDQPNFKGTPADATQTVAAAVQGKIGAISYIDSGYAQAGHIPKAALTVANQNATYIVMPLHQKDPAVQKALTSWLVSDLSPEAQALAARAGYTPLSSSQTESAMATANPSGEPQSQTLPKAVTNLHALAEQDAFQCAVSPFAGASDAVGAFYSHPAVKGQRSWVVRAAAADYRSCIEGIAPKGRHHDQVVKAAEDTLTGPVAQLAALLGQHGNASLTPQSPAQLRNLSARAQALAKHGVDAAVRKEGPTNVTLKGVGSLSGEAAQYIIDHDLAKEPVAAMIATTLTPGYAVTAVSDAAASIGV